jgi:hypothetical protein
VALGYRLRASVARPHPQRHITSDAAEEILCGRPHKISYTQLGPADGLLTARHSIGSMNSASRLGSERKLRFETLL